MDNDTSSATASHTVNSVTMADGTLIAYKDWGSGPAVVFSHGWPLAGDAWEDQMFFLASRGYRVIAHDRRGHGLSSKPWNGNDMDTYADDLATLKGVRDCAARPADHAQRPAERRPAGLPAILNQPLH